MQRILKRKGPLKIAVFVLLVLPASYFAYKHIKYSKTWYDIHVKQKSRLVFSYKFEIADSLQKGYLLLSPYIKYNNKYSGELIVMDFAGHILVQKQINGEANDFRQWKVNGHIRYTYFLHHSGDDALTDSAIKTNGRVVVLDSSLKEIKKIYPSFNDTTNGKYKELNMHDFVLLSDDHYLIISDYEKIVNNVPVSLSLSAKCKVILSIIQEIKYNKVIWQWNVSNYPEFYANSVEGDQFNETDSAQDYAHLNSMIIDPRDSNLIVSFRNENQVVKINRHTGDIMWRLGGKKSDFPLTAQQVFLRQHNATLTEDNQTLVIFDNGEQSIRPSSRVLEFNLDEKNKTIASFKVYNISEKFSPHRGSVQKVGGDYFICGGYSPYLLWVNSITGTKKMKMLYNQALYRAYVVKDITGIKLSEK